MGFGGGRLNCCECGSGVSVASERLVLHEERGKTGVFGDDKGDGV